MTERTGRPSPETIDVDRNGRDSRQDPPLGIGLPVHTQAGPRRDPAGGSEASVDEAIERATAAVGQDDGKR